ncbi:dihydroorotate dehydrogenase [Leptotrichia sp. OH3620_COT-345]|uniref:dihydroorotate dehydrogenase n=1 Tax=Leptotrichia sp. OH3620_COT-345 TaxID=2491048 RepID=UPI000F64A642|nr:dihydroorotate dehydrogenase [Leptotrichia sp. OH3620_COT-345]RRD39010.1 dihydroorotate dehydrogenase [Leptotrichia sp. OH3620_COT-345]
MEIDIEKKCKSRLETTFMGVKLQNPVMTGSGCFAFGLEYMDYFNPNKLGAIITKGLTLEMRKGNNGIRIAETPAGILNSVGLENPGIDYFEKHILPEMNKYLNIPIVGNINGKFIEEYVELTKRLDKIEKIKILELNISCPNVKDGGMAFGANPEIARKVTGEVRKVTKKPLMVKLSPNVTNIVEIAKIAESEGADGISMINTLLGMSIDVKTRKAVLGNIYGGLSGPAVKPIALRMIHQVSQTVSIPILGMGGISNTEDAIEFFLAGASAISLGTAFFPNPMVALEVIEGLEEYCKNEKLNNISEIIGYAHSDNGIDYRKKLKLRK